MARYWVYACSAAARSPRACATPPSRAVRDRQVPLPAGVGGIQRGQPLGDGQVLGVRLLRRRQVAASLRHITNELYATARSRCQPVLAGSSPASRSEMARYWAYACSAAARSPRACATSPTRLYATARSRCQPVLAGSSAASRSEMARYWVYACSAAARSPRACATSPTRLYATARSCCQPVLAGSSAASRSEMARDWAYACSAAARSPRACATSPTSE